VGKKKKDKIPPLHKPLVSQGDTETPKCEGGGVEKMGISLPSGLGIQIGKVTKGKRTERRGGLGLLPSKRGGGFGSIIWGGEKMASLCARKNTSQRKNKAEFLWTTKAWNEKHLGENL